MSQDSGGFNISFKTGANLDTTTSDFMPVRIGSASSVLIANSTTHKAIGILQNRPNAGTGAAAWVRVNGTSKIVMNDTCTAGDLLVTGTAGGALRGTGLSITAATSRFVIGYAIESCAATATVIQVLLMPSVMAGTLSAAID